VHLEIVSRSPSSPSLYPPLLFVHGAFGGAWMWDEHFLPYFAENGYEAHALSLRGHGENEERSFVHGIGLTDYVEDLNESVLRLTEAPVLIGHSLGGVVVQKWLKRYEAPGAVLMGSGPPHGMLPSSLRMMLRAPAVVMQIALAQAFGPRVATADAARKALFSESVPVETVDRHFARASPESLRVGFELALPDFPGPTWNRGMPLLVLGAENDFFVSPTMVEATAKAYGARAEIFPDMAHAMMLEPGWQGVADRILRWLPEAVALTGTS
jgi:pimeloyl-ACP methyl ester carboxylesterase